MDEMLLWFLLIFVGGFVTYVIYTTRIEPYNTSDQSIRPIGTYRGYPEIEHEGRVSQVTHYEFLNDYELKLYLDFGRDCVIVGNDEYDPVNKRQAFVGGDMESTLWRISKRRKEAAIAQAKEIADASDGEVWAYEVSSDGKSYKEPTAAQIWQRKFDLLLYKLAKYLEERDQAVEERDRAVNEANEHRERSIQGDIDLDLKVDKAVDRFAKVAAAKPKDEGYKPWGDRK